ncbi:MAG: hypothetical protein Q7S44_04005 [bacterium]|nr:hypothetical protein [bacterium]
MNCEICGKDPETINVIPKRQYDGRYDTFACNDCAVESGMYCQKHQRPLYRWQ